MLNKERAKFCHDRGFDLTSMKNSEIINKTSNKINIVDKNNTMDNSIDNQNIEIINNEKDSVSVNICSNCGTTNSEDSKFCYSCEKLLE